MTIGLTCSPDSLAPFQPATDAAESGEEETGGTSSAADDNPLYDRLRLAYLLRFEEYERQLRIAQSTDAMTGRGSQVAAYPSCLVRLIDENGLEQSFDLVIDEDLHSALFDVYVYYGPQGFSHARAAVEAAEQESSDRGWVPARTFFDYTVNGIRLLVREALMRLEPRAVELLTASLSVTASAISKAYSRDFRFEKKEVEKAAKSRTEGTIEYTTFAFRMADQELAKALFAAMAEAIAKRDAYEQRIKLAKIAKEGASERRERANATRRNAPSAGFRSPYDDNRDDEGSRERDARDAERGAANAARDADDAGALFLAVQANIFNTLPHALLALPRLHKGFTIEAMQSTVGEMLFEFYGRIDSIATDLARPSSLGDIAAGIDPRASLESLGIEGLYPRGSDLEATIIRKALAKAEGEPRLFALLAADVWRQLYENEATSPFERVVCRHWLDTLDDALEQVRLEEEASARFWQGVGRLSAALSLAQLVPSPAAVVLRTAAAIADVVMLLHTVYSVAAQLESINVALGRQVVEFNLEGMTGMMRLGALMNERREYREQLVAGLATELALMSFSQFRLVKKVMATRGYLQDVEAFAAGDE